MIYKKQDIDQAFTAEVRKLLGQGYQINPATMGGSQGEIAKVDLCKGNEILRVWLDSCSVDDGRFDCLRLIVGRYTANNRSHTFQLSRPVWSEDFEILSEIKFAKITNERFVDLETRRAIFDKRVHRRCRRQVFPRRELGDAYKSIALRYVRKQPRMKNCRLQDIESVTRVNCTKLGQPLPNLYGYEIKAKGKTFLICAPKKEYNPA